MHHTPKHGNFHHIEEVAPLRDERGRQEHTFLVLVHTLFEGALRQPAIDQTVGGRHIVGIKRHTRLQRLTMRTW